MNQTQNWFSEPIFAQQIGSENQFVQTKRVLITCVILFSARELQSAQSGPAPALSRGRPGHTAIAEEGLGPLRTALDLADPGRVGPSSIPIAHEGNSTNVDA